MFKRSFSLQKFFKEGKTQKKGKWSIVSNKERRTVFSFYRGEKKKKVLSCISLNPKAINIGNLKQLKQIKCVNIVDIIRRQIKKEWSPVLQEILKLCLRLCRINFPPWPSGQSFQATLIKCPSSLPVPILLHFQITLGLPVSIFKSTQQSRLLKVLLNHLIIFDFLQLLFSPIIILNPALNLSFPLRLF